VLALAAASISVVGLGAGFEAASGGGAASEAGHSRSRLEHVRSVDVASAAQQRRESGTRGTRSRRFAEAAADPPCFGAAARDPRHACENPRLRYSVVPDPSNVDGSPNAPCTRTTLTGLVHPCAFGVRPSAATRTIALIGDSHASHWRAALAVVAGEKRWRGLSITTCPLSKAVKRLDEPQRTHCVRWKRELFRWFRRHREVRTVFVSQIASPKGVVTRPGADVRAAEMAGYVAAWKALPRTVERIIVLRDSPHARKATAPCIERAMADHRRPGPACALSRRRAVKLDTAVVAARRLASPRVRVIDMTRFFCDTRRCYPVIGGVLVYKDENHMTPLFSRTLGPFLLRRL
jgi:hypothetical protein